MAKNANTCQLKRSKIHIWILLNLLCILLIQACKPFNIQTKQTVDLSKTEMPKVEDIDGIEKSADDDIDLLIDDFDDKDFVSELKGGWRVIADRANGGNTKATLWSGKVQYGKRALKLEYTLGEKYGFPYALAETMFNPSVDLTEYNSLCIMMKGDNKPYKITLKTDNVKDYNYYTFFIDKCTNTWKYYKFDFSKLKQDTWGKQVPFELDKVLGIHIITAYQEPGYEGGLYINKLGFSKK